MLLVSCCLFFFFKQKTAYEMRISDWSSDVCSSDLFEIAEPAVEGDAVSRHVLRDATAGHLRLAKHGRAAPGLAALGAQRQPPAAELVAQRQRQIGAAREIGRASCRERVCPYV